MKRWLGRVWAAPGAATGRNRMAVAGVVTMSEIVVGEANAIPRVKP